MMFWGWIPPGLNLSEIHARGRGGLQPEAPRDCSPPWGSCPQSRARWSSLGFGAARPAQTTFFLISRVTPVFTKRRRLGDEKSLFVRRFVACFFARQERNWRCRRGKSPPPQTRPLCAASPNDRDRLPVFAPPARTPAPATPPQSACSRRLSGCPQRPNLFGRRLPESPKGKGKRKEEARMPRPPPGLARPLRLRMAGRAPSRNAPAVPVSQSVAESPQNNQGGL